jgi:uncharacterized membrane-anchored protein
MNTYNKTLATTIDLINDYLMNYYNRKIDDKPEPLEMQGRIWTEHKINHEIFEAAMRIMKEEGYIDYIFNDEDDTTIRELKSTPKGWLLYLNGGMLKQQKREKNKDRLYLFGQISLVIAAVYYLLSLYKLILDFFCR